MAADGCLCTVESRGLEFSADVKLAQRAPSRSKDFGHGFGVAWCPAMLGYKSYVSSCELIQASTGGKGLSSTSAFDSASLIRQEERECVRLVDLGAMVALFAQQS